MLLISAFLAAPPCRADDQGGNVATARHIIDALHLGDGLRAAMPSIMTKMRAFLVERYPQYVKQIDIVMPKLAAKFSGRLDEGLNIFAKIFAQRFSTAELKDLLSHAGLQKDSAEMQSFKTSPLGQKFLAVMPDIRREMIVAGEAWGAKLGAEVDKEIASELRQQGVPI